MTEPLLAIKSSPTKSDADVTSRLERELRTIGSAISLFGYMSLTASVVCMAITGGIFFISKTLTPDRRVFFLCVLAVCFVGFIIVIVISRKHATTFLLFNILLSIISAFTLGLAICYA